MAAYDIALIERAIEGVTAWAPGQNIALTVIGQLNKASRRLVLTPGFLLLNQGGFSNVSKIWVFIQYWLIPGISLYCCHCLQCFNPFCKGFDRDLSAFIA
jgi:hypothetical protein